MLPCLLGPASHSERRRGKVKAARFQLAAFQQELFTSKSDFGTTEHLFDFDRLVTESHFVANFFFYKGFCFHTGCDIVNEGYVYQDLFRVHHLGPRRLPDLVSPTLRKRRDVQWL